MKTGFSTYLYIISLFFFLGLEQIQAQQNQEVWERKLQEGLVAGDAYDGRSFFVHERGNKEYVVMASTYEPLVGEYTGNTRWMLLDSAGRFLQEQKYSGPDTANTNINYSVRAAGVATSDGGYAFVELVATNDDTIVLTKLDTNGLLQWQMPYATNTDTTYNSIFYVSRLQELNNGDFLIIKEFAHPLYANGYKIVMQRVSSTGVHLWEHVVHSGNQPSTNIGGQFVFNNPDYIFEQASGHIIRVHRARGLISEYDSAGNLIAQIDSFSGGGVAYLNSIPVDTATKNITASAGVYAATQTAGDGIIVLTNKYLVEFDSTLEIVRIETIGVLQGLAGSLLIEQPNKRSVIEPTNDGGYILVISDGVESPMVVKLDAAWNIDWKRPISEYSYPFSTTTFYDIQQTSDQGYILAGQSSGKVWVVKTDSLGRYKTNAIQGNVYADYNNSCSLDTSDIDLQDVILTFESTTTSTKYYTNTNADGFYTVDVPKGSYTVQVNSPFPFFDTLCPIDSTIVFLIPETADTFDLPLAPTISCPMATVNIAAVILRRGLPSYYVANYCNHGTADAQGVYIEIELDNYFNVDSMTMSAASQVGNTYTFNIGDLDVGDCGQIHIYGTIDTSALFGQTHCSEARIFPDSVCIPNFWNGPIMEASSTCQNDSIFFQIENKGVGAANNLQYLVYEDHVIFMTNTVTLGSGGSTTLYQPAAPGKTYRIEVQQEAGFPSILGSSYTTTFQEGCNAYTNGTFETGYVTQFYNGNTSPFVSLNCVQNVGSYDPNDKQAQQVGYGTAHYIEKNTPLTYKIRFQNTGTDTAFRVVLIDTLSAYLDPSTIQLQVASHDYTWDLSREGVLRVTFNNIMLPDSNANEMLSHGFVEFTIQQQPNNPLGTVIHNQAGIYFDWNAPIITNQTYHTIGENFVSVLVTGTENILVEEAISIKVYPNPFATQTTLEVEGGTYEQLELTVYDMTGRNVLQQISNNHRIQIARGNLPQGIYVYQLKGDGGLINTGKLIIKQ